MVESVDTLDLKSNGHYGRAGSSPASSTKPLVNPLIFKGFLFINPCCTPILIIHNAIHKRQLQPILLYQESIYVVFCFL